MFSRFNLPPRRKFCNEEPSRTIQSAAEECNINKMIARYQKTGSFHGSSSIPTARPQFGEFVDVPTYQEAQQIIIDAQNAFADLSSDLRDRFRNDPAEMLSFLADPANKDEAIKLGLCASPPPDPALEIVESEGKTLLRKKSS